MLKWTLNNFIYYDISEKKFNFALQLLIFMKFFLKGKRYLSHLWSDLDETFFVRQKMTQCQTRFFTFSNFDFEPKLQPILYQNFMFFGHISMSTQNIGVRVHRSSFFLNTFQTKKCLSKSANRLRRYKKTPIFRGWDINPGNRGHKWC